MKYAFSRLFSGDDHMREIAAGSAAALTMKLIAAGLGFVFYVAVARLVGADGAGRFSLCLILGNFASLFGRLGLDNTLLRYTASSAADGDWGAARRVCREGLGLSFAASAAASLFLIATAPLWADGVFHDPGMTGMIRWMTLFIIPSAMYMLTAQLLKGLKAIGQAVAVQSVWHPFFALLLAPVFAPFWGVTGVIIAYSLAAACAWLAGYVIWRRRLPEVNAEASAEINRTELLSSSLPLFWGSLLRMAIQWTPPLLLGAFAAKADVGVFSAAYRAAFLPGFILIAVNSIAAPKFAELYRLGRMEDLGRVARKSTALCAVCGAPILFAFLAAPGWIMSWFGPDFIRGGLAFAILAVGQFIGAATGPVDFVLVMCGREKLYRNYMLATALTCAAVGYGLISHFGVMGAAWTATIVITAQNIGSISLVRWKLGIWTLPWWR
ncbi:MAG: oligosaccharide flippase family protein [bacterium]|nr:oligosaccharide flippase family protein [bacterium]